MMTKIRQNVTKNIGFSAMLAGALAAATTGLAGPAAATPGIDIPVRHAEYSRHSDIGSDIGHDIRHDIGHDIRHDMECERLRRECRFQRVPFGLEVR